MQSSRSAQYGDRVCSKSKLTSPAFFRAFGSWPLSESLRHCASCRRGSSWGCHAIFAVDYFAVRGRCVRESSSTLELGICGKAGLRCGGEAGGKKSRPWRLKLVLLVRFMVSSDGESHGRMNNEGQCSPAFHAKQTIGRATRRRTCFSSGRQIISSL